MTTRGASVCLVSMPFMPVLTPALGPSLLKAGLGRDGIDCDLYYGSLEWLKMTAETADPRSAALDYSFIASTDDLGDAYFARALWQDPGLPVALTIAELPLSPNLPFPRDVMVEIADRLMRSLDRVDEFFDRCLASRDWAGYEVIGFSSTFCQNVASLVLARRLKEVAPDSVIVFGGANCEGEMGVELLRSFPWIDEVIQGEADLTFPAYVRSRCAGRRLLALPGLVTRERDGTIARTPSELIYDMDALADPDFSDYFDQRPGFMADLSTSIPVETSRGCWWGAIKHCTFCGLNPSGMTYRSKSPDRALSSFKKARDQWGSTSIVVVDNIMDMRYLRSLLPDLTELGLSIFYETKSNLREKHVRDLAAAGVKNIQPGVESLNSGALDHMRKGANGVGQIELLKWCSIYGVDPLWFYLYRFPMEDPNWYYDDIALMKHLWHLPPPRNPNPVIIDRFSPMFFTPEAYGLSELRPAWNNHISYSGLSAEARARLAYHFDATLPEGTDLDYEVPLWQAVMLWQDRYGEGAHLTQEVGDGATLVCDGRSADGAAAYLLVGSAHVLYTLMRTGQPWECLVSRIAAPASEADELSVRDLELSIEAANLGASLLEGPGSESTLGNFLESLTDLGLALHRDDRWLALATDPQRDGDPPRNPHVLAAALSHK